MISILLTAASAAALVGGAPVQAEVVGIDLQRPVRTGIGANTGDSWYNRIELRLESAEAREIRLCPGDLSVMTERQIDEQFIPVDRFRAHVMRLDAERSYTGSCRTVAVAPGQPAAVTFLVSAVPGGRHRGEDRYTVRLDSGSDRSDSALQAAIAAP